MVTGALYHTDIGVILALLSNMPDKPHSVPKDIKGRTARLGHAFYKKTIGNKSRIDIFLLEDGRSAVEDISLTITREVPAINSNQFCGYELNHESIEKKFKEVLSSPSEEKSAELYLHFETSPEYRKTQIPDVHDVLWVAAGQLDIKPTNHITPFKVPMQVWAQIGRAVIYDVLCYYDRKIAQKAERIAQKEKEKKETFYFGK
jgi:hypothetical protein